MWNLAVHADLQKRQVCQEYLCPSYQIHPIHPFFEHDFISLFAALHEIRHCFGSAERPSLCCSDSLWRFSTTVLTSSTCFSMDPLVSPLLKCLQYDAEFPDVCSDTNLCNLGFLGYNLGINRQTDCMQNKQVNIPTKKK